MTDTEINTWDTPHLQGLMAPVSEERDDIGLDVIGEIPAALNGMFVRNGPNQQFAPLGAYHPFDGDGMLHGVTIENGTARYCNRWIESKALLAERKRGTALYGGMSNFVVPEADILAEAGMMKNTGNTATVRHAGHYFGLLEAGLPTEFDRNLETLGEYDFGGRLRGPMTAHPKIDPMTGEMVFFGYGATAPFLQYHEVDASGALVNTVDIDIPAPVMMHDFVMTSKHVLVFDSPAVFDLDALLSGGSPLGWRPENGTRIGVLPRGGSAEDLRWYDTGNCYVVHFFNAFEDGNKIEVHAPRMDDMPGGFEFVDPGGAREPMPWKWTIDLETGTVNDEQFDDVPGEFPRINDNHAGQQTRYAYNCPARSWEFAFDFQGVVKYDHEAGTSTSHYYSDDQVSGEHAFAPDPDGTAEDDGWLMSFVTDRTTETSELAIIDARDVAAGPVARVQMAARVPIGFHASWFAD
jgi:carotenoid cleavage dioxygenase-like enzyme